MPCGKMRLPRDEGLEICGIRARAFVKDDIYHIAQTRFGFFQTWQDFKSQTVDV